MSRSKLSLTLSTMLLVLLFSTLCVHAWSFMPGNLNAPYNQCLTCHVSNSDLAMNPYGRDYLEPSHATTYHNKHNSDPGDCNNCHSGKGYPLKQPGLDDMDSDGDAFTNLVEFNSGTFPGDPSDYPVDTTAPVITAFSLPAASDSLTVAITSFTATDDIGVTGFMLTESSVAPAADDSGWSVTAPAYYTFGIADIATLYAWAKDAAGNVSTPISAQVDTTPSQQHINSPPVALAGMDRIITEGQTVKLDAGGSTDDVGIISYAWVQLDGPGGSPIASGQADAVVLSDPNSVTPYFVTPAVSVNGANLTFELTVTDGDGAQDTDEVYITIDDNGITDFNGLPRVVPTLTSGGKPIGIITGSGNALIYLATLTLGDMPAAALQPRDLPYGLVNFMLKVNDAANSYITIHFPAAVPADYKWYKYTAERGWFNFDRNLISGGTGEGAVFSPDRTRVTIYIDDNSAYDDNPTAGIVSDPGGLAAGIASATPMSIAAAPDSNSFGSTNGCFLRALPEPAGLNWPVAIFSAALFLLLGIEHIFSKRSRQMQPDAEDSLKN